MSVAASRLEKKMVRRSLGLTPQAMYLSPLRGSSHQHPFSTEGDNDYHTAHRISARPAPRVTMTISRLIAHGV